MVTGAGAGEYAIYDGLFVDRESLCMMGYVARSSYAMRVRSPTCCCLHQPMSSSGSAPLTRQGMHA